MMIKTVAWTCFEKRVSQQVYNPDYPDTRCMTDKVSDNEIISSSQEKRKYKLQFMNLCNSNTCMQN